MPAVVSADANSGFASKVVSASTSVVFLSFPLASADGGADDGVPSGDAAAEGRVSATFTLVAAVRDKLRNSEETEGTSRVGMRVTECHHQSNQDVRPSTDYMYVMLNLRWRLKHLTCCDILATAVTVYLFYYAYRFLFNKMKTIL
jgi:hypothetical protein